ncbi:XRE family transcriptional regulator [Streptomyces sp. NBC_00102]|uniref:XRE family transcriptional regulator n=1 Tax=Streptomyces sp. NBC_00102 TaxID=2975652 RepID=UPI002B1D3ABC|nr:XRE family transcriptional regulator [Streptomyces sp. NBC_00102]
MNERLSGAMREGGFTQAELADSVNARLIALGHDGTVSDRTIRNWLTGRTSWPHPRQREALEAVFGCGAAELGFRPPAGRSGPAEASESPVNRRRFLTAAATAAAVTATATAAATGASAAAAPFAGASPFAGAQPRVGTSDVLRLRSGLDTLTALDDFRGGHTDLEGAALAGAAEALEKQRLGATGRVRLRLFSVAAEYTATAAWSALDARRDNRAHALLGKALYLAGMGQDPVTELRVWNSYAMLARQRGEYREALDSGLAAQSAGVTKRDPLFASLAHARTAVGYAYLGERQSALRSLGYAGESLARAGAEPRVRWMAFYGPAELTAITAVVLDLTGDHAGAEAASHRAVAAIPGQFRRNRALATARLALAQLHQRDIDQACATASTVFALMAGSPIPGRMRSLLGEFRRDVIALAPDAAVGRQWADRYRSEWSRA